MEGRPKVTISISEVCLVIIAFFIVLAFFKGWG